MRCLALTADGGAKSAVTVAELPALVADRHNIVWLDLESPKAEELALLSTVFSVNQLTVEDVAKQGQRAKVESYDHYVFLVIHAIRYDVTRERTTTPEIDLILGTNFLISVHDGSLGEYVPRQLTQSPAELLSHGADFLMYTLVDGIVDSYFPVLDMIDDQIDALEDDIVSQHRDNVLARIFKTKRDLIQLRKVISPQIEVFTRLSTRTYPQVGERHLIYFRDVHDHLIRAFEVIDSYRDLMSGALDAYLSTVNNRLNEVMKRLTVIATIFMPITFITGVFGQNFGFQPQVQWDTGHFFWAVLAGMGLITIAQIWYYWRKGWL